MIRDGKVLAVDGTVIGVNAQTVGVHSDQPGAVEFCRTLVEKLRDWSLVVRRAVSNG
jgi:lactam utilization protein B